MEGDEKNSLKGNEEEENEETQSLSSVNRTQKDEETRSTSTLTPPPSTIATAPSKREDDESDKPAQVKLHFLAVGGAPILKKSKFQVRENMTIAEVLVLLRKTLKIRDGEPLFLYLNSSFAPGLDQSLKSLQQSFNVNGELKLEYAITSSWG